MSWGEFKQKAKIIEEAFAKKLKDPVWADRKQDMFEHWDVKGILNGKLSKFDVKGIRKINRYDKNKQDDITWIEGTNVHGYPGWIKGKADYIVFERLEEWLIVKRESLLKLVNKKLEENNFEKGKGIYKIYQREGRKDKLTMVPFDDIKKYTNCESLKK